MGSSPYLHLIQMDTAPCVPDARSVAERQCVLGGNDGQSMTIRRQWNSFRRPQKCKERVQPKAEWPSSGKYLYC